MRKAPFLFLGFAEGLFSAALGIGGGVIIVPALVILFNYKIKDAAGTSLATIAPIAFIGFLTHAFLHIQNVKFLYGVYLLIGMLLGVAFISRIEHRMNSNLLVRLFVILLLIMSLKLIGLVNLPTMSLVNGNAPLLFGLLGLFAGMASFLFGIGGGVLLVPFLTLFFGFSIREAIPTSLLVIFPTALFGAVLKQRFHEFNFQTVRWIVPTALVGAFLGAVLSNILPTSFLEYTFGLIMIFTAVKMYVHRE
ncbi:sulfite exporter TauE/SafE family protein [Candidatus Woesearchaeota archaeon]|nr:sulfite exporter TauE/SafE family protein [Candidatus Woesearchaeota archaeon]